MVTQKDVIRIADENGLPRQAVADGLMLFGAESMEELEPYLEALSARGPSGCAPLAVSVLRREVRSLRTAVRALCVAVAALSAAVVGIAAFAATSAVW